MKTNLLFVLVLLFVQVTATGQDHPNLFPNGNVENTFINQVVQESGHNNPENSYRSHIEPVGTGLPTYWRLSKGATLSKEIKFSGDHAIQLARGKEKVTATVHTDYWTVKDADMPFGQPLVPNQEITASFRYKTAGLKDKNAIKIFFKLGVIKDLPAKEDSMFLPPSDEWKLITRKITLSELKWGAEITFTLSGDSTKSDMVWIDDACLNQHLDGVNLVKNYSFEDETIAGTLPPEWDIPIEDQWVSWVGARYRKPVIEIGEAVSGNQSLRASVTYIDGSGLSQIIRINQKEVKPIAVDIWSKLDNSIGNRPPGYWGPDNFANLTLYIYHNDGTMQEVSPLLCLGESDHDWDYRRFGFVAQKPVKEIMLQITVLGSEPTTSLWVDDVRLFELNTTRKGLEERGVVFPKRSISSEWSSVCQEANNSEIQVSNNAEYIYLTIPKRNENEEISIYLNPKTKSTFINHYRYLFDVIKIDSDGQVYKGITVEKQGYTADGEFKPAQDYGIETSHINDTYQLSIPFTALQNPDISFQPFGFNVLWKHDNHKVYWNGKAINNKEMGRIILDKRPGLRVKSLLFGKRYFYEKDQSQDFVSHPQVFAGENEAVITLVNDGKDCQVAITAGIKGESSTTEKFNQKQGETKTVLLHYQAGLKKLTDFNVAVTVNDKLEIQQTYPVQVPSALEFVLDQEYYFAEENTASIEIHNRYRPIVKNGKVEIEVTDLMNGKVVDRFTKKLKHSVDTISFNIIDCRVNSLPVQDYLVKVTYIGENGKLLSKQTKRFGKIYHTKRRELPPIEKLTVDDKGRIIINDDFRFFPIVPSVNVMDWHDAIDLGANVYRGYYREKEKYFEERDRAWEKNVYDLTIGPMTPEILDKFQAEAESFLVHPGFLGCYGKQFYYWKLEPEYINYRKRVEKIISEISSQRLVIWGHHDSSFLYDLDQPEWPVSNPPVGYCYVKIMGRPGSTWRNAPFLTKTEQVLNPHRFKLAEVNYYVAFHSDEVVPLHFPGNLSLRGDDWQGVRNESYLSIIYGATGLYHWVCTQKKDLQRLRGWFQELNYMWPVFVADEAQNKVKVLPYDAKVDVQLKKWNGKYYLLTANRDESVQKASIKISGFEGMKVKKLFELAEEMSTEGNLINDVWEKYDVHVYEIEK